MNKATKSHSPMIQTTHPDETTMDSQNKIRFVAFERNTPGDTLRYQRWLLLSRRPCAPNTLLVHEEAFYRLQAAARWAVVVPNKESRFFSRYPDSIRFIQSRWRPRNAKHRTMTTDGKPRCKLCFITIHPTIPYQQVDDRRKR